MVNSFLIKLMFDPIFDWYDSRRKQFAFIYQSIPQIHVARLATCYWRDARLPPAIFSKRARGGGGGLMVWGGISYRAKTPLVFVSGNMDATAYTTMLENTL